MGWELRGRTETTEARIELRRALLLESRPGLERWIARGKGENVLAQKTRDLARLFEQARTIVPPDRGDALEQGSKTRPAIAVLGREVRAREEGLLLRGQEDGHGPAALAVVHREGRRHVDVIEVRPLFAIDLDADEVLVHDRGDRLVLEGLPLHHVTPVTGGVPDREEDGPLLIAGAGERLFAPGIPVDRIVRVLEQVR